MKSTDVDKCELFTAQPRRHEVNCSR